MTQYNIVVLKISEMFGSISFGLVVGAVARLLLVAYGVWQDKTMVVKFTDVDYNVFTDAARHITKVNMNLCDLYLVGSVVWNRIY